MSKLKIVLAGGGTSGHRLPVLTVYHELAKLADVQGWYFGTAKDVESPEIQSSGLKTVTITSGKLRRYLSWENLTDLGKVWRGWRVARAELEAIKPDVVFVKGGYVSVPVALAAKRLGIPVVTHESDAVLGLANKIISRAAEAVAVTFPVEMYPKRWRRKMHHTGPIMRPELIGHGWQSSAKPKQIMILGGSQGSRRIDQLVWEMLPKITKEVRVYHQTGPNDLETAQQHKKDLPEKQAKSYLPVGYIAGGDKLVNQILKSEIVISRSGSTIFELALLGVPSILIPLSTSAGGHQAQNARHFADRRAALVLDETTLTADELLTQIKRLLNIRSRRDKLSAAMRELAVADGAAQVAALILAHANR